MKALATTVRRGGILIIAAVLGFSWISAEALAQARGARGGGDSTRVERRSPARQPAQTPRVQPERSRRSGEARGQVQRGRPERTAPQQPERGQRGETVERQRSGDASDTVGRGRERSGTEDRSRDRGRVRDEDDRSQDDGRVRGEDRGRTETGRATTGRTVERRDRDRERYEDSRRGGPVYVPPKASRYDRPRVRVDVVWPWVHRYNRGWAPRYEYRQVVYVESGWARQRYDARLDVRTVYRHRVRYASRDRAEVDIYLDRIELYEDGYFLGEVDRIPSNLGRIRATIYRSGRVRFDRDVFVVGDPRAGFELISTRHYDGFILNAYHRSHGYRVGVLDLRRERVVPVRYSRLFDPYDFRGFVPISLLPDDTGWLCDYGYESPTRYYWGDDDAYYYGYSDGYDDDGYDAPYYSRQAPPGDARREDAPPSDERVAPAPDVRFRGQQAPGTVEPLRRSKEDAFQVERGDARVRLKRESEIKRID